MRLIGVAMIRNERDLIEAWLEHHLARLDALVVLSHQSTDGTLDVLTAAARQGARLTVLRDASAAFRQGLQLGTVMRQLLPRLRADWAFALDADEFLCWDSRAALEAELSALPADSAGWLTWRTYLPAADDGQPPLTRFVRRLLNEPGNQPKVVVRASLLSDPDCVLADGNHGLLRQGAAGLTPLPHQPLRRAWLAHIPVRSHAQIAAKVRDGYAAIERSGARPEQMAWHWRDLHARLSGSPAELSLAELTAITLRYYAFAADGAPAAQLPDWTAVDDPIR